MEVEPKLKGDSLTIPQKRAIQKLVTRKVRKYWAINVSFTETIPIRSIESILYRNQASPGQEVNENIFSRIIMELRGLDNYYLLQSIEDQVGFIDDYRLLKTNQLQIDKFEEEIRSLEYEDMLTRAERSFLDTGKVYFKDIPEWIHSSFKRCWMIIEKRISNSDNDLKQTIFEEIKKMDGDYQSLVEKALFYIDDYREIIISTMELMKNRLTIQYLAIKELFNKVNNALSYDNEYTDEEEFDMLVIETKEKIIEEQTLLQNMQERTSEQMYKLFVMARDRDIISGYFQSEITELPNEDLRAITLYTNNVWDSVYAEYELTLMVIDYLENGQYNDFGYSGIKESQYLHIHPNILRSRIIPLVKSIESGVQTINKSKSVYERDPVYFFQQRFIKGKRVMDMIEQSLNKILEENDKISRNIYKRLLKVQKKENERKEKRRLEETLPKKTLTEAIQNRELTPSEIRLRRISLVLKEFPNPDRISSILKSMTEASLSVIRVQREMLTRQLEKLSDPFDEIQYKEGKLIVKDKTYDTLGEEVPSERKIGGKIRKESARKSNMRIQNEENDDDHFELIF